MIFRFSQVNKLLVKTKIWQPQQPLFWGKKVYFQTTTFQGLLFANKVPNPIPIIPFCAVTSILWTSMTKTKQAFLLLSWAVSTLGIDTLQADKSRYSMISQRLLLQFEVDSSLSASRHMSARSTAVSSGSTIPSIEVPNPCLILFSPLPSFSVVRPRSDLEKEEKNVRGRGVKIGILFNVCYNFDHKAAVPRSWNDETRLTFTHIDKQTFDQDGDNNPD